jgi:hypothetical protein
MLLIYKKKRKKKERFLVCFEYLPPFIYQNKFPLNIIKIDILNKDKKLFLDNKYTIKIVIFFFFINRIEKSLKVLFL